MKSLLAVTRFTMEDTLRSLVMDNHAKFVAFVAAVCSAKVCIVYTRMMPAVVQLPTLSRKVLCVFKWRAAATMAVLSAAM